MRDFYIPPLIYIFLYFSFCQRFPILFLVTIFVTSKLQFPGFLIMFSTYRFSKKAKIVTLFVLPKSWTDSDFPSETYIFIYYLISNSYRSDSSRTSQPDLARVFSTKNIMANRNSWSSTLIKAVTSRESTRVSKSTLSPIIVKTNQNQSQSKLGALSSGGALDILHNSGISLQQWKGVLFQNQRWILFRIEFNII